MSSYPNPTDADFYDKIDKKFNKYKIPSKKKTLDQICFPKKYEFQIPQKFLAEIINPKTPYKGILVYHRIGAGKTCTAINIAEKFKHKTKIMIVLPASLQGNFRSELRSQCAGDFYLKEKEREILKTTHPSDPTYKKIIDISDERINEVYTIYSYNKFISLLQEGELSLSSTLLIIDEVHNLISETGIYYETIYDAIHTAPSSLRTVLMTATPIFDKPGEIALTMNLLLRNKQLPIGPDFIHKFINIRQTSKGPMYSVKNIDLFKKYIRGYVSYYRGAPPHVFPRSELHFVKCKMSDRQRKLYQKIIKIESKKNILDDYVNFNISNSFFIGTRMVSNVMFPNNKIGEDGYNSLADRHLSFPSMKIYCPKFLKILRKIKKCEGTVFVYSSFKEYGGIKSFVKFLEYHHFKNYEDHNSGSKRFAIWSGDQNTSTKDEIKAVFNNSNNTDGSKIKIILASPSAKEGVSFLRVQEVHLLEPYWNFSRMDQIMGRAIRFCSHKDVPISQRLVKVYIYLATHPDIRVSIDEHIMRMAIQKKYINGQFEKALKSSAIDCELFWNANVYETDDPDDQFECVQ